MISPISSIRYLYEARFAFVKIDDNIYQVTKSKDSTEFSLGRYVKASAVVDALNNSGKVLIHTNKQNLIHANFKLREDEEQ
jgi:hypothetical protein